MLINRDHRVWAAASAVITVLATISYVVYSSTRPYGPSGGSWVGLGYGVIGTAFMLLAGLLSVRKRFRTRRIGSAQLWMKAHIWLSLLAIPFILFHAGFRFGGPLSAALLVLFLVVSVSGLVGLAIQQALPSVMTTRVPLEALHSQLEDLHRGLAMNAYETVASVAGAMPEALEESQWIEEQTAAQALRPGNWKRTTREQPAASPSPESAKLRQVYLDHIRPYLLRDGLLKDGLLKNGASRNARPPAIAALLPDAPADWVPHIDGLTAMCEESRQFELQARLHRRMHGWLFVHAPLALAVFVLAAFHIWFALSYKLGG